MCVYWHAELGVNVDHRADFVHALSPKSSPPQPLAGITRQARAKEHLSERESTMLLSTTAFLPITSEVGSILLTGGTTLGLIVIMCFL